jgi:Tfp pilus assembly protein PilF
MNHPIQEDLKVAQAETAMALKFMESGEHAKAFQHVERAMSDLRRAHYELWHYFAHQGEVK